MPATNALSEESFSALRRIKNYLRVYHDAKRDELLLQKHSQVVKILTLFISRPTLNF